MFGFMYYIGMGITKFFISIYEIFQDIFSRYKTDNGLYYRDRMMNLRSSQTNKPVYWEMKDGREVLMDFDGNVYADKTWNQIINKAKRNKAESLEKGRSTSLLMTSNEAEIYDPKHKNVKGNRYLDLKTNKTYVVRKIGRIDWYVDIDTGNIVRKTDQRLFNEQNYLRKDVIEKEEKECNEIIEKYKDEGILNEQYLKISASIDSYNISVE